MDMLARLADRLGQGARIGTGRASVSAGYAPWSEETFVMARATPARQAEFAAGRAAARLALRAIGMVPFAIPMGPDRAPVWPHDVVGSITHHGDTCLAIAARRSWRFGLGIDLECDSGLPTDLWPEVLNDDERLWLSQQQISTQGILAKRIFSAKEASYKALYPLARVVVGFDVMSITLHPAQTEFTAVLHQPFASYSAGTELHGYQFHDAGKILTGLALHDVGDCGQNVA